MQSRDDSPQPERDLRQARDAARSTEQLPPTNADWSADADPISPGWRSERSRTTSRRQSAARRMPANTGDLMLWLQRGGWRWLALAAGLVVLLIIVLALRTGSSSTATEADQSADAVPEQALALPTVTTQPQPTQPPPPSTPQAFVVAGTNGQGLFLRPDANTDNAPLKTLPDGTKLEKIGDEVQNGDYVWVKVRDPEGAEGWVARDFIQPAS